MQGNQEQRLVDGILIPPTEDTKSDKARPVIPSRPGNFARLPRRAILPVKGKKVWLAAGILMVTAVGFLAFKFVFATHKVITRNVGGGAPALAGDVDPAKLRGEGDGRVNILLLGIGGQGHQGSNLSDTIMVLSIDPRTKDTAMLSLPRDLFVPIPGFGKAKINAAHAYGESQDYAGGGPALAKAAVSALLDLPIHYFVRLDFSGFKKAVDALSGIDIMVDKDLYDPAYPSDQYPGKTTVLSIKAGLRHMDGETALRYSRSRHSTSDFDRAKRQQQVLLALRQKALSLEILANPSKLSGIIDLVGSSAKTDIQLFELKKLADIAQGIDPTKMNTKVLDTSSDGLLKFANVPGFGSCLVPKVGINDFSEIRAYAHAMFADSYIQQERAALGIEDASGSNKAAAKVGEQLKSYHYRVLSIALAAKPKSKTVLYDYTQGRKPYTLNYLEQRFGVKAQSVKKPPGSLLDIKLILGTDYQN